MIQKNPSLLLALAVALAACGGGDGGTTPTPQVQPVVVQIASGNLQAGVPGQELWEPLVVRATRAGQPVPNLAISFTATDGQVNLPTGTTDAAGEARVRWVLPATDAAVAAARVRARFSTADGADSVSFTARVAGRADMDLVVVEGGGPATMVVYDAGGYQTDERRRFDFADSVRLWALRDVNDEIAAFAPGRAPLLVAPQWSQGRTPVRLQFSTEIIRIPLTIWVVQPPFDSTAKLVQRHLEKVHETWELQGGIGLRDVRIVDATGFAGAAPYQNSYPSFTCVPSLFTDVGRDTGRMNAYYVGQGTLGSASYCGDGNMLIFPLSWERSGYTLAHEIGHGFLGLFHESIPDNPMHFQGNGTKFTAGQIFRAHYSSTSILNTMFNAHPESLRRTCNPDPASPAPGCLPTSFVLN